MKFKLANLVPLAITGVVLALAVSLHIVSRQLATQSDDHALVEQLEWLTYDARVKLGAALNDQSAVARNMATLFFDDQAFKRVNDGTWAAAFAPATNNSSAAQLRPVWPWPRYIHGQVVRELSAQGASIVGFDVLFPELMQRNLAENVPDSELGSISSDEFFGKQLKAAGNVLLAVEAETLPAPLFRTNAAGLVSISARPDNGVLRRVKAFDKMKEWHPEILSRVKPLQLRLDLADTRRADRILIPRDPSEDDLNPLPFVIHLNPNGTMKLYSDGTLDLENDRGDQGPETEHPYVVQRAWNLGLAAAARYLDLDLENPEIKGNQIVLRGPNGIRRTIPTDSAGFFYIDWSLRFQDLKKQNSAIYSGQLGELLINDKFRTQGETDLSEPFRDKLVVIGSVAKGNNVSDLGSTPLEQQTPLVTKHLNIANSVLTGRFIERTSLPVESLLIVVLGAISALLTWKMRVLIASVGVTGLCLCYIAFTVSMYLEYRYWIPLVMPMAGGLILPHFSLVTYRVIFEQNEQKRVRHIFSKIVAPDVVQELLSAEKLSLGGARRKITVFFADVRGFTEFTDASQAAAEEYVRKNNLTEAEKKAWFDNQAAESLATVNLYLSVIADMVKKHNGTLDKFMGDCVMAFWGAPVANEKHALHCVRAAVDSQRAIYALNQERFAENERRKAENLNLVAEGAQPRPLLPLLTLGSGINTGDAVVGLMGSDATILNYTVFGREVNLASRLEAASGRGRIFISEATYLELRRDDPERAAQCIAQNPVTPKGFRHPVAIYEVPWKAASEAGQSLSSARSAAPLQNSGPAIQA